MGMLLDNNLRISIIEGTLLNCTLLGHKLNSNAIKVPAAASRQFSKEHFRNTIFHQVSPRRPKFISWNTLKCYTVSDVATRRKGASSRACGCARVYPLRKFIDSPEWLHPLWEASRIRVSVTRALRRNRSMITQLTVLTESNRWTWALRNEPWPIDLELDLKKKTDFCQISIDFDLLLFWIWILIRVWNLDEWIYSFILTFK